MKILDCTLRDGGYYTNWDFNQPVVNRYIESLNALPIDYLEVGYRSIPMKDYLGKYFYCPVHVLEDLKSKTNKKHWSFIRSFNVYSENSLFRF